MLDPDKRPLLCEEPIRFDRYGYFPRPITPNISTSLNSVRLGRWLELQDLIERAKRGDFDGTPRVLELYRESYAEIHRRDWAFEESAIVVLGRIGTAEIFKNMRAEIEQPEIRNSPPHSREADDLILDYCQAFHLWGRLDAVQVILDQYLNQRFREVGETDMFPIYMAHMLHPQGEENMIREQPPEDLLEDYLNLVMNRYDELAAELGSERTYVAFGERLCARTLARRISQAGGHYARFRLARLRERFEPMTGIDCTGFFTVDPWTPLAAAALAEDFLADPRSAQFEAGARYFFGHRVPD